VVLPKGASVVDEILRYAVEARIKTAKVEAIGGVNRLIVAYYDRGKRDYEKHEYNEFLEVTSALGNITQKEGVPFLHLHGNFGRRDMSVIGGHIISATVYPTLEVVLTRTTNTAVREYDDETGLNLIRKLDNSETKTHAR
jgi:predicted DNA-binding protein with PD1-like motif